MLSCHEIPVNVDILFGFWNTYINSSVFPFGMMSPTLLDVAAITRLPLHGDEVRAFSEAVEPMAGFKWSKPHCYYSNFITANSNSTGEVTDLEHHAFLLYWMCIYFICTNLVQIVAEVLNYVQLITSGRALALGRPFLGLHYRSLFVYVERLRNQEKTDNIPGPLWFLHLWILHYFPEFVSQVENLAPPPHNPPILG